MKLAVVLILWLFISDMIQQMMLGVHMKLNPELPWLKQHSTRRRLFSPANLT
jgi:hypothetical protein